MNFAQIKASRVKNRQKVAYYRIIPATCDHLGSPLVLECRPFNPLIRCTEDTHLRERKSDYLGSSIDNRLLRAARRVVMTTLSSKRLSKPILSPESEKTI